MIKLWRRWVTSRYYAAVNRQLAAEVPDGATVFDLGCADGSLLLSLAPRISSGLGIDQNESMITVAAEQAEHAGHHNLTFADGDVSEMLRMLPVQPTHSIVSLLLHELPRQEAQLLLRRLGQISERLLIADLVEAPPLSAQLPLGLGTVESEFFDHGGIPSLLHTTGLSVVKEMKTPLPFLRVWVVKGK